MIPQRKSSSSFPPQPPNYFPAKKKGDSISEGIPSSIVREEGKARSYSEKSTLRIDIPKYDVEKPGEQFKKFQKSITRASASIPLFECSEGISIVPMPNRMGIGKTFLALQNQTPVKVIKPIYLANPRSHEPILQYGIPTHETGFRERIGFILSDQSGGFLFVPPAELKAIPAHKFPPETVPCGEPVFCSVHDYIPGTRNLSTLSQEQQKSILEDPVIKSQIRKITICDICLANTDGGTRNTLVNENRSLTRIDLGLILPSSLEASLKSIGLYSSSTRSPFTQEEKDFIHRLNFSDLKRQIEEEMPGISKETLITLKTTTETLKVGAEIGMSPYEIGSLMFKNLYERQSFLECCLKKATSQPKTLEQFELHIATVLRQTLPLCKEILDKYEPKSSSLDEDPRSPILRKMTLLANEIQPTQERPFKSRKMDPSFSQTSSKSSQESPSPPWIRPPESSLETASISTSSSSPASMQALKTILESID